MFIIRVIILLLISFNLYAKSYNYSNGMTLDTSGYLGWKQIISNVDFDSVKSEPELGLNTSLKITDRLTMFNQFAWGRNIDEIFVYNQLTYIPELNVDDLTLTIKGGRIMHNTSLYSDTRINPRTRQGVLQPQSIYFDVLNRALTSGTGFGIDADYKNFKATYVIDKLTIVDPNKDAQAWALTPRASNLKSDFGTQIATLQHEIPTWGVRTKAFWLKNNFSLNVPNLTSRYKFGGTIVGIGTELTQGPVILSVESQCAKLDTVSWSEWKKYACGISSTIEYDIHKNITLRANYNQYHSPRRGATPELQTHFTDMNVGVNLHKDKWMLGTEVHYMHGGRLVDTSNFNSNPSDYERYWLVGINLVYFID